MLHFLTNHKFDLLSYFYIINFLNLPLHALIHDLQKKNIRASTRTHDPFFDNSEIWPTFIYRGEVPGSTFAKLPVRVLINDPKKNWYRHQLQPMLHFLMNHKFDLLSYFYIINFLNLPLCALIHDLQKKNIRASTRTHDPFFDNSEIWPTFIYRGEVPAHTFAKLPVHALINDPKKLFQKKVYVTIPQWFETFPNMSDLRSGRNRAKCGLVLNDPIDWFKLRLNQPTIIRDWTFSHHAKIIINSHESTDFSYNAGKFFTHGSWFCTLSHLGRQTHVTVQYIFPLQSGYVKHNSASLDQFLKLIALRICWYLHTI